jgi:hypothetical protein
MFSFCTLSSSSDILSSNCSCLFARLSIEFFICLIELSISRISIIEFVFYVLHCFHYFIQLFIYVLLEFIQAFIHILFNFIDHFYNNLKNSLSRTLPILLSLVLVTVEILSFVGVKLAFFSIFLVCRRISIFTSQLKSWVGSFNYLCRGRPEVNGELLLTGLGVYLSRKIYA